MSQASRLKLTQRIVDAIRPGGRRFVWDESLPGFGIRVTEGAVSYVVDFKIGQRRRRVAMGSTGLLSYAQARDQAAETLVAARKGIDLTVSTIRDMPTFQSVWDEMIELDALRCSPATIADYQDRAKRLFLPALGTKLVSDIKPADVEKAVGGVLGARNKAYALTLIKKAVNFARDKRHYLPETHRNPAASMKLKPAVRRPPRALEVEEIRKFGEALAAMEGANEVSPWLANLIRLSLICGLRPGEVRTITWDRINVPRRRMQVVGKTGEREVHLTDAAVLVLEATPKVQGCPYVFAGRRYGQPIASVHKQLKAIQDRAGVERFRPYDLRHSAATGALATGADLVAVQALLGHTDLRTTQGYLHASEGRRRAAAERAAAFGRGVLR